MVIGIVTENLIERGKIVTTLRNAFKRYEMDKKAFVTVSPENYLVLHIIVDSSATEQDITLIRQMKKMVHLHLSEEALSSDETVDFWIDDDNESEEEREK